MTTAGPSRPTMDVRHHPYARPKWQTYPPATAGNAYEPRVNGNTNGPTNNYSRDNVERGGDKRHAPPSPPRSRRDASETPPLGLGVAFGGASGGKWWDEELPPPPASLSSILDSFRRSGEGDRDLLLSILGAKKAEEERLTALIQTRLTILQARLSLHSAAASLAAMSPAPDAPASLPLTHNFSRDSNTSSSDENSLHPPMIGITTPTPTPESNERTPSLSGSRGSPAGSPPLTSPQQQASVPPFSEVSTQSHRVGFPTSDSKSSYHHRLLSPHAKAGTVAEDRKLPPLWVGREGPGSSGPGYGNKDKSDREVSPKTLPGRDERRQRSGSGGSNGERERNGLDMLLDAGMRGE